MNIKDLRALNMWYEALDQRYNFSLGPTIFGLVTSDGLAQLTKHDLPFLKMFKTTFKKCVNTRECHEMAQLKGKTKSHRTVHKLCAFLTLLGQAYLSVSKDRRGAHCAPPEYFGVGWGS